jgi:predicted RNase H-like HicB family nuclease
MGGWEINHLPTLVNQLKYLKMSKRGDVMQYQIFVQSQSQQSFLASVVGMSNLTTEGKTEEEAISKAKSALESQLAKGKFVNVEIDTKNEPYLSLPSMKYAGIFANDSSFDDFMEKLNLIRQEANLEIDD